MARGGKPGSSPAAEALNWSMVLVLAAEFQGFARELHDEGADFLASTIARGNTGYFTIIRNNLVANRGLDRVNAKSDTLKDDFERLGLDLWTDIMTAVTSGKRWKKQLDILNIARNSIAHNQLGKLQGLKLQGYPLNFSTVSSWRVACNGLSRHMDLALKNRLVKVTGIQPW